MQRTVELDSDLESELTRVATLAKVEPSALLQEAVRAGLPTLSQFLAASRPPNFFAADYGADSDRVELEAAMSTVPQHPER